MITIFVEGNTDALLIESLFGNIEIKTITYSSKKNDKINNYIKSLDKMNEPYFFLFDTDKKSPEKITQEKLNQIKFLKRENCFPVIMEIESWYRAGCSENVCKKYKIKSVSSTESYSKEQMKLDFNTNHLLNIFQEILLDFSASNAFTLSASFKRFYLTCLTLTNSSNFIQ